MTYSYTTYRSGDPWTTTEFFGAAITPPRISTVFTATGNTTTASYFEYRRAHRQADPVVEVSIAYATGSGLFNVALEISTDGGATWIPVQTYTSPTIDTCPVRNVSMFRLRAVSIAGGTTLAVSLRQTN